MRSLRLPQSESAVSPSETRSAKKLSGACLRRMAECADGVVAGTSAMTIEINGMAHVILTVSRFDLARAFYGKLLPEFG